jgi:ABC-type Fe3+-siderophore transport system permease subunit
VKTAAHWIGSLSLGERVPRGQGLTASGFFPFVLLVAGVHYPFHPVIASTVWALGLVLPPAGDSRLRVDHRFVLISRCLFGAGDHRLRLSGPRS